jgi:hypothetical protein
MPSANLTSPHKEAANAVLKASVGLAKADAEFPEDAQDKLLIGEDAVAARNRQFPMSESRPIMGVPRRRKVSTERSVKRYAPHSAWRYCARFSASLWAAAAPGVAALLCLCRCGDCLCGLVVLVSPAAGSGAGPLGQGLQNSGKNRFSDGNRILFGYGHNSGEDAIM